MCNIYKRCKVEIVDYVVEERKQKINKLKNQMELFKYTLMSSPVEKARIAL